MRGVPSRALHPRAHVLRASSDRSRFWWRRRRCRVDGALYSGNRLMDAWIISENVKALARAPKVLAMLEEFYGRKPLPFQTLNFPFGTEQTVHSDAIHFNSMPATFMCGVWVALEDM